MEMVRVPSAWIRVTFRYILDNLQKSPLNSLALSPCLFFSKEKISRAGEIEVQLSAGRRGNHFPWKPHPTVVVSSLLEQL